MIIKATYQARVTRQHYVGDTPCFIKHMIGMWVGPFVAYFDGPKALDACLSRWSSDPWEYSLIDSVRITEIRENVPKGAPIHGVYQHNFRFAEY